MRIVNHYLITTKTKAMFGFINNLFGTSTEGVKELIEKGAVIIDVRQPEEFKSGHIDGAINMPLPNFGSYLAEIKKMNKPVVAYCASGNRSGMATRQLEAQGIEAINGGGFGSMQQLMAE